MARASRKRIHETLVQAKTKLLTGNELAGPEYRRESGRICTAVDRCSLYYGQNNQPAINAIHRLIQQRLGGYQTIQQWLQSKGVPVSQLTFENVQRYRHTWLDSLIDEYSK